MKECQKFLGLPPAVVMSHKFARPFIPSAVFATHVCLCHRKARRTRRHCLGQYLTLVSRRQEAPRSGARPSRHICTRDQGTKSAELYFCFCKPPFRFRPLIVKSDDTYHALKLHTQVSWHPFMLDPSLPAPGTNKMALYRKKFGARFDAMIPHMKQVGSTIGVNFSYGGNVGNTLNSHRLVTWAQKQGADAEDQVRFFCNFKLDASIHINIVRHMTHISVDQFTSSFFIPCFHISR